MLFEWPCHTLYAVATEAGGAVGVSVDAKFNDFLVGGAMVPAVIMSPVVNSPGPLSNSTAVDSVWGIKGILAILTVSATDPGPLESADQDLILKDGAFVLLFNYLNMMMRGYYCF